MAITISGAGITSAQIQADGIDGTKIADDAINSEHLVADSIDAEHLNANSVNTDAIIDSAIRTAHIQADNIVGSLIADDAVDSEHIAAGAVDDAHIVGLAASKLSGTIADARFPSTLPAASATNLTAIPAANITGTLPAIDGSNLTGIDLQSIRRDIATLALHSAVADNKAAYNLPSSFIDQFQDDTGIGTETDVDRNASEYIVTLVATSFYFNGQSFLSLADSSLWNYTNSIWTWETWQYRTGTPGVYNGFFGQNKSDNTQQNIWQATADPEYRIQSGQHGLEARFAMSSANTWHHIAVVADGSTFRYYLDGVNQTKTTGDVTINTGSTNIDSAFWIGNRNYGQGDGIWTSAYWDNIRLSNVVRYASGSTFTPSTTYFTSDSNTQFLLKGSTGLTDQSSNSLAITQGDSSNNVVTSSTQTKFPGTTNATGTLISTAQTANAAQTKVSGVILYKNNAGTATLGTDLKVYFTCNGGTNWTESTPAAAGTFSTGILMAKCPEVTCTSGTDVRYKVVWANQAAGSKETQLHGIAMNY